LPAGVMRGAGDDVKRGGRVACRLGEMFRLRG
jgi:hypothetical protein